MSLPEGVTTCTVTYGKAIGPLGTEAAISATLTMDRKIVHAESGWSVNPADEPVTPVVAGGVLSFAVPHVDQDGFIDASGAEVRNWYYVLQGRVVFPSKTIQFQKVFQVVVGQDTADLDIVPDGPPLPGFTTPLPEVLSVAGETGVISTEVLKERLEVITLSELESTIDERIPAAVPVASTTAQGKVELATTAETTTGLDTARAVTPAGLDSATLASPARTAGLRMRARLASQLARTSDVTVIGLLSVNDTSIAVASPVRAYAYDRTNSRVNTAIRTSTGKAAQGGATSPKYNMITRDTSVITWERHMGAVTFTASTDRAAFASAHGLSLNDQVRFDSITGATGVSATMYVKTIVSSTVVTLSATSGGAQTDITADGTATDSRTGVETGTGLAAETYYDGDAIDLILYNNGSGTQRVFVDDVMVAEIAPADFTASGVASGTQGRLGLTFNGARPRVIKWETLGGSLFVGYDIQTGKTLSRPPTGDADYAATLMIGDSFIEGTGSDPGRPLAWWAAACLQWHNAWKMGSGSIGVAADGARVSWSNQIANLLSVISTNNIRRIVGALGLNDRVNYEADPTGYITSVQSFWSQIVTANPFLDIVVFGPWPDGGGQGTVNASLIAMDADLAALFATMNIPFFSPIKAGWSFTLSSGPHPDVVGHQKLGWLLAGAVSAMRALRTVPLTEVTALPATVTLPEPFTIIDTFERTDSAASGVTLGTTERGAKTWAALGTISAAYVSSGTARLTTSARSGAVIDTGLLDGHWQAVVGAFPAAGIIGQWLRAASDTDGLIFSLNSDGTSGGTLGYSLLQRTGAGITPIAVTTVAPVAGDVIDIYLLGASVQVYINGALLAGASTASAPVLTGTKYGPYSNGSGNSGSWREVRWSPRTAR